MIDAYIRVSAVGIELLTIDARIVIASVDTYLRFAHAVNRMDLTATETHGIPELMKDGDDEEEEDEGGRQPARRRTTSRRRSGEEGSDDEG